MTTNNEDIGKGQGSRAEKPESFEFPSKLQEILADHHLWLESQGKDGKQGNLVGWDLSGLDLADRDLREINFEGAQLAQANLSGAELGRANLSNANLKEADLSRARLQGADLRHANLEQAKLTAANLRNAKLLGANFPAAKLVKTDFRDADLQDAKLKGGEDLLGWQLAGTNLTYSELPETLSLSEELSHAGEITKTTATLLWTLLTGCLYACLTVATTTDASFYVSAATLRLPIIDATIPTWGFFILAPVVLMAWYFYFLLNLQRLWEALVTLPAVFPDGMRLDQKASPWFITGLVCSYFPQLQTQKIAFLRTQKFLSLVLVWWIAPLTLIFVWIGYLKARFWPITLVQILSIVLAIFLGFRTWRVAKATLQGDTPRPPKKDLRFSLLAIAVLLILSVEVINLVPPRLEPELVADYERHQKFGPFPYGLYIYYLHNRINDSSPAIGSLLERIFLRPFVNIDNEEVSIKPKGSPADWDKLTDSEVLQYLEKVKGAWLGHTNLRHSHAKGVFLAKANLKYSNLAGAYLNQADLRDADLSGAYLLHAMLADARLQGANLQDANLRWANLRYAKFQGADLTGADLTGANLQGANLKGANLRGANLEMADLIGARELTPKQIREARCWPLAFYDNEFLKKLGLKNDYYEKIDRFFVRYDLHGLDLQKADLRGALLKGANLQNADLKGANLDGAILDGADLTGAKNLTKEQLKSVKSLRGARLPDDLRE